MYHSTAHNCAPDKNKQRAILTATDTTKQLTTKHRETDYQPQSKQVVTPKNKSSKQITPEPHSNTQKLNCGARFPVKSTSPHASSLAKPKASHFDFHQNEKITQAERLVGNSTHFDTKERFSEPHSLQQLLVFNTLQHIPLTRDDIANRCPVNQERQVSEGDNDDTKKEIEKLKANVNALKMKIFCEFGIDSNEENMVQNLSNKSNEHQTAPSIERSPSTDIVAVRGHEDVQTSVKQRESKSPKPRESKMNETNSVTQQQLTEVKIEGATKHLEPNQQTPSTSHKTLPSTPHSNSLEENGLEQKNDARIQDRISRNYDAARKLPASRSPHNVKKSSLAFNAKKNRSLSPNLTEKPKYANLKELSPSSKKEKHNLPTNRPSNILKQTPAIVQKKENKIRFSEPVKNQKVHQDSLPRSAQIASLHQVTSSFGGSTEKCASVDFSNTNVSSKSINDSPSPRFMKENHREFYPRHFSLKTNRIFPSEKRHSNSELVDEGAGNVARDSAQEFGNLLARLQQVRDKVNSMSQDLPFGENVNSPAQISSENLSNNNFMFMIINHYEVQMNNLKTVIAKQNETIANQNNQISLLQRMVEEHESKNHLLEEKLQGNK